MKNWLYVIPVLAVGAVAGVFSLSNPQPSGADTAPIVQQVQHNTDELANHEARISNTENDVRDLQNQTSTPPSSNRTDVPIVPANPATSTVAAPNQQVVAGPVTVVRSGVVVNLASAGYCHLLYSDGTSGQAPVSWVTDGTGNAQDNCASYVGQVK